MRLGFALKRGAQGFGTVLLLKFAAMGREKIGPIERLRCTIDVFQKPKWKFWMNDKICNAT